MTDLARQLAAHPRWEWRAGMLTDIGERVTEAQIDGSEFLGTRPDLNDDATKGVLRGVLRTEWPGFAIYKGRGGWVVFRVAFVDRLGIFDTEGEAIARALLDAWGTE